MTNYIIKNCPCYELSICNYEYTEQKYCVYCTDCPIKQVVELCKKISDHAEWCNCPDYPGAPLASRILQTLQVEEVE